MNKKIVGLSIVGIVAVLAMFSYANAAKQDASPDEDASVADIPPTLLTTPTYQYVAKFACGLVQPNTEQSKIISPGDYKTIINIHNPQTTNISYIKKKVVIASQEEPRQPIPPIWAKMPYRDLQSDYSFRIDCPDIYSIAGVTGGFIEGFVVLYPSPSRQLDVTALYTAGAPLATAGGSVVSMDVEVIKPKISVPATTSSYVDSPP